MRKVRRGFPICGVGFRNLVSRAPSILVLRILVDTDFQKNYRAYAPENQSPQAGTDREERTSLAGSKSLLSACVMRNIQAFCPSPQPWDKGEPVALRRLKQALRRTNSHCGRTPFGTKWYEEGMQSMDPGSPW